MPVTDSTQAQPDGYEMSMMGCMGIEDANSAKKFWEDHPAMHKAYHFGGWSCQIGNRKLPIGVALEADHNLRLQHGRTAAKQGKHIQACPFDTGRPEWREWRKGFCDEPVTSSKGWRKSMLSVTEISRFSTTFQKRRQESRANYIQCRSHECRAPDTSFVSHPSSTITLTGGDAAHEHACLLLNNAGIGATAPPLNS